MKRLICFIFVIFLFGCTFSYQNKVDKSSGVSKNASDETYIVKTVKDFDTSLFAKHGAIYKGEEPYNNLLIDGVFYSLRRDNSISEKDFIECIENLDGVYYVDKNEVIEAPKTISSDEVYSTLIPFGLDQGNLSEDPDARNYEYALCITQARDFFDADGTKKQGAYTEVGYGNNTAVIAIIDTGLNMRHLDFKRDGRSICLYAKSFYSDTFDIQKGDFPPLASLRDVPQNSNEDNGGHGTHCSGTMCAVEGNNEGIAGVAYKNTYIISYKGLGKKGGSSAAVYTPLADLAEIVTILKKDPSDRSPQEIAKIPPSVPNNFKITQKTIPVNMSLGGSGTSRFNVEMINLAIQSDILPVIAMGNDGRIKPSYPRSIYGCIAVGATNHKDKRADFSEAGEWISVCAPGFDIVSTSNGKWANGNVINDSTGVQFMSGTSMATPFVTGLIGYLLSFDEGQKLNAQQIKRLLELTADKIDKSDKYFGRYVDGHSLYYGYGRVNVLKAAQAIEKKSGAVDIPKVDSFYLSKPMKVTTPYYGMKVRLYEILADGSYFPQGLAITDKKNYATYFYGLKKDVKYRLTCEINTRELEHIFTATDVGDMEYNF